MSGRTKWFRRLRREGRATGHATKQRVGRVLSFEHCESRVALSTTGGAWGEYGLTAASTTEGGMISFDAVPIWASDSNSAHLPMPSLNGSSADSDGHTLTDSQLYVQALGTTSQFDFREAAGFGRSVRLIESPLERLQHPEGGHIAIIDQPGARIARLAGPHSALAAENLARQPAESSAPKQGIGRRDATGADGLRGRAVVFEVAHASTSEQFQHDLLATGKRRIAWQDIDEKAAATQVANLGSTELPAGVQDGKITAARISAPTTAASSEPSADLAVDLPAPSTDSRDEAPARNEWPEANAGAISANARNAAIAARDAALAEWDLDDGAPVADPESTASSSRSRKVLALGLALTLGSVPASKFLRRRRYDRVIEQRPPRRRLGRYRIF